MMVRIREFILILTLLFSFGAHAKVECPSLDEVKKQTDDDLCEALSDAAENCFAQLNYELELLKAKKPNERKKERESLKSDYQREIDKLNNQFLPELKSLGESAACVDEAAEVEEWVIEYKRDLMELDNLR